MTSTPSRSPVLRRARLYLAATTLAAVVATGAITAQLASTHSASATTGDMTGDTTGDTTGSSDSTGSSFGTVQPPSGGSGVGSSDQHSQTAGS